MEDPEEKETQKLTSDDKEENRAMSGVFPDINPNAVGGANIVGCGGGSTAMSLHSGECIDIDWTDQKL